jgi:hypothetical protein
LKSKTGPGAKFKSEQIRDALKNDELTTPELRKRVMDEIGMSRTIFYELLKEATQRNLIFKGISGKWERVLTP